MGNKVAVAISGGGRTLENLVREQDQYCYEIAAIISSSEHCKGNLYAKEFQLPLLIAQFSPPSSATRTQIQEFLDAQNISWIALGGFLKPFPILPKWQNRIINIHPALLPAYGGKGMYGMHVHQAVYESQETVTGATIHFVSEEYDKGEIIAQARVDISNAASPEDVAALVFSLEKKLLPKTLDYLVAENPQEFPITLELEP